MPEPSPAVRGLYSIDGDGPPALEGRRCGACGYVFFPPHDFGCDACGALPARVQRASLQGAGVLRSLAVVHRHGGSTIEAPFTVGEIALDAGPTVRAVLMPADRLVIGDRMRSVLFTVRPSTADAESVEKVDLRFEKAH